MHSFSENSFIAESKTRTASIQPKMTIYFATNNLHKLEEIRAILSNRWQIGSLVELNCTEELPETRQTLECNSLQKAAHLFDRYKVDCFADDTGLEVAALDGAPGVYSARYAGLKADNEANIDLLLKNMVEKVDRTAQFRTVITLIYQGKTSQFTGIVKGTIAHERVGIKGFGYDAIFIPEGANRSFAEMLPGEKNKISHRARAVEELVAHLHRL